MAERVKPIGEEYIEFSKEYDSCSHTAKLEMAERYGISYDTLRHWKLQGDTTPKQLPLPEPEEPRPMRITIEQLLKMETAVNLDFACFDLESSNLNADFSIMLSAVVKPFGREPIVFRGDNYPSWKQSRTNDSYIVRDVAEELGKHAIIVTHYGSSGAFDLPYLRAKMVHHGIAPMPTMFGVDTYRIAKANFKVSSRRLQNLVSYFDIGDKGGVEGALWMEAAYDGTKKAMDEIVEHNIIDVLVLEKLACVTFPYLKSIPRL